MTKAIFEPLVTYTARLFDRLDTREKRRLRSHAVAALLVAGAVALKLIVGTAGDRQSFALLQAAVAGAALTGGFASAWLAVLLSMLAARLLLNAGLPASFVFAFEAMLISAMLVYLRGRSDQLRGWLAEADAEVRDLRETARRGRLTSEAFSDLERASQEHVAIVLSAAGTVIDWRSGAARLYLAEPQQTLGASAGLLFYPELQPDALAKLLGDARANGTGTCRGTHRRFDGTLFEAEVQFRCIPTTGGGVFIMLVHDLTDRQAAEAFARHATERQHELREEITLAHDQLASLELVTDPYLNAMPGTEAIATLLARLRTTVKADGIAIVRRAGFRPRLFWAPEGLKPEPPMGKAGGDESAGRTLLIHNDSSRVSELSVVRWPDGVRSMIAVPLLRGGQTHAVMEVVYQRGPRSTDWEIALIQVAAARAASLLPDESFAVTGAVA